MFAIFLLLNFTATAQDSLQTTPTDESTFSINIGQDIAFGFYLGANGSVSLRENLHFTYYANYWANPAYGNPTTGTDYWTEVGIGLQKDYFNKQLIINPTLGFTFGKDLSGGTTGVIGDGIVPNLVISYCRKKFESQLYVSYYAALRKMGAVTLDYFWYSVWMGRFFSKNFSAGAHFEHFMIARKTGAKSENVFQWLGIYLETKVKEQYLLRLTLGAELLPYTEVTDFYKLYLFIPF